MDSLVISGIALLTLIGVVVYLFFLWRIARTWHQAAQPPAMNYPAGDLPFVSVLVPARNEAEHITACLTTLQAQAYPTNQYEIIVIDDQSTDATAELAKAFLADNVHLLHNQNPGKKAALQLGIDRARGQLIVTTDADCEAPPHWLDTLVAAYQDGGRMLLAPVRIHATDCFLTAWQGLDVAGTMLLTGASVAWGHPLLANGANLAFDRSLFQELDGYKGNTERASGDDIFLLQKAVHAKPEKIFFIYSPQALVSTTGVDHWRAFWQQRLRWAAKTSAYRDWRLIFFQANVYLINLGLVLGLIGLFVVPGITQLVLYAWLLKLLGEYFFLRYANRQLGHPSWLRHLPLVQLTHPFYIVIIGTLALLPIRYRWKGRTLR